MPARMKFDVMFELQDVVCVDATAETCEFGAEIRNLIKENHSTREKVAAALKDDADICEALRGHSIDLAVLVSVTLGTVTMEFSTLVLSKVRKLFGVVLH